MCGFFFGSDRQLLPIIINNSVLLERGHFFEYNDREVGSDRIRNYIRFDHSSILYQISQPF